MSKIAVGLSGGVDSAVAALLLRNVGHEIVGVHLYCYPPKSEYSNQQSVVSKKEEEELRAEWIKKNGCRADEDKQAALKTTLELGIPFKTLDFSEEYNSRVIDYFYREYEAGRTPNPDVLCNSEIKFGLFLRWALENNFDYIATGHYASVSSVYLPKTGVDLPGGKSLPDTRHVDPAGGGNHAQHGSVNFLFGTTDDTQRRISMKIPKDKFKDQTYFLWKLTQKELSRSLFPLGDLEKSEVRKIALEASLSVAGRPDSQGICFVGNVNVRRFLARRLKVKKGEVKNPNGEVIGTHNGVWFYTIGQRGGWTIKPEVQALISRTRDRERITPVFYVVAKDAKKNELVVGVGKETERQKFGVGEVNWMGEKTQNLFVRIRHGGKLLRANLQFSNSNLQVMLGEPQRGVAPGQSAVFYGEDGEVLGGGVIC